MAKRMIAVLVLMIALISGLGFIKYRQVQAMAAQFAAMQPPPEAVTTIVTERATARRLPATTLPSFAMSSKPCAVSTTASAASPSVSRFVSCADGP